MLGPSTITDPPVSIAEEPAVQPTGAPDRAVRYGSLAVDGLSIAYRESGRLGAPKLVLLHGFPASSHQYRNLVSALAGRFHVLAPDYPGFGLSDRPDPTTWPYTFDRLAEVIERFLALKGFDQYGLFVQDYGGPVGFRIVSRHPEALEWLIVQNSNAYEVGFTTAWDGLRGALWQHRSPESEAPLHAFLSPETIRAIYRNQAVTFVGLAAHLLHYSKRLAPWVFYALHNIGRGRRVREKTKLAATGGCREKATRQDRQAA